MTDFFTDHTGASPNMRSAKRREAGERLDPWLDRLLSLRGIRYIDKLVRPRWVLIVGIEVPGREADIHAVLNRLKSTSLHHTTLVTVPMAEGLGKFANVERALASKNLDHFDWIIIADDDVSFEDTMLDRLITLSEAADLSISQPAHALSSFAGYQVTLRKPWAFVRETHFVEIGPVTAFHKSVFQHVIPFSPSRWCYGIDLVWSALARKHGFKMGIVDAAPVRHLRPIAGGYDIDAAIAEGVELTKDLDITSRAELLGFERVIPTRPLVKEAKKDWARHKREFRKILFPT